MLGTLRLSNYRGFSDEEPVTLCIQPGRTAIVGPNNSGKSSLLRAPYELASVLSQAANNNVVPAIIGRRTVGVSLQGVEDSLEIVRAGTTTRLRVELEVPVTEDTEMSRLVWTAEPDSPQNWTPQAYLGPRYSELPTTAQHVSMQAMQRFSTLLAAAHYVPAERTAIAAASGQNYSLNLGVAFINEWDQLRNGPGRTGALLAQGIQETLAELFGYTRLDITPNPGRTSLQVVADGKPFTLRELGAGFVQFLMLLTTLAYRRPSLLFIDEPELHLHPALQLRMVEMLTRCAEHSIYFGTHSFGLARVAADHHLSIVRGVRGPVLRPLHDTRTPAELVAEMTFSAYRELGFDTLLFVEGRSDAAVMRSWLRKLRPSARVLVLPLGGTQYINTTAITELTELRRLAQNIFILIDSERSSEGAEPPNRVATFLRLANSVGLVARATERRAIENYLTQAALDLALGPGYAALQPCDDIAAFGKGFSKEWLPRIAEAMSAEEVQATDVGRLLLEVAAHAA